MFIRHVNFCAQNCGRARYNSRTMKRVFTVFLFATFFILPTNSRAQSNSPRPKMATDIPVNITTPDSVQTSIGTLKFVDGLPDKDTVTKVYDNLDLMRGIDVFLNTMSAASLHSNIVGL